MKKLFFISRHEPTKRQETLASNQGFQLVHVGDMDAFQCRDALESLFRKEHAKGFFAIACVHPALAMTAREFGLVGVFENANRAPEGERPRFEAIALHMFGGLE